MAKSYTIIAETSSRAFTACFVAIAVERIPTRWAFTHITCRAAVTCIAQTSNMLVRVPRKSVSPSSLLSEELLGPACTMLAALVRTNGALTGDAFVSHKAFTSSSLSVTDTLVRALSPRMKIVRVHNTSNPCVIPRTSAQRTVRSYPIGFAI